MPFGKTYEAIKNMILLEALYVPTARDIARRAGLFPGRSVTGAVSAGLLAVANAGTEQALGSETAIAYSDILSDGAASGISFMAGSDTLSVNTSGLYRATATLSLGTPSGEGLFGHALVTSGERAVMEAQHYVPTTYTADPERIVLGGTATLFLEAGEEASHVFYATFGTAGNVLQDPEATRLYVERVL